MRSQEHVADEPLRQPGFLQRVRANGRLGAGLPSQSATAWRVIDMVLPQCAEIRVMSGVDRTSQLTAPAAVSRVPYRSLLVPLPAGDDEQGDDPDSEDAHDDAVLLLEHVFQ